MLQNEPNIPNTNHRKAACSLRISETTLSQVPYVPLILFLSCCRIQLSPPRPSGPTAHWGQGGAILRTIMVQSTRTSAPHTKKEVTENHERASVPSPPMTYGFNFCAVCWWLWYNVSGAGPRRGDTVKNTSVRGRLALKRENKDRKPEESVKTRLYCRSRRRTNGRSAGGEAL